jgi:hypothetical protein
MYNIKNILMFPDIILTNTIFTQEQTMPCIIAIEEEDMKRMRQSGCDGEKKHSYQESNLWSSSP